MLMSVTVPTYHCAILLLISNINQLAADIQAFVTSEFCLSIMPTGGTAGGVGRTGARQTKGKAAATARQGAGCTGPCSYPEAAQD